MPCRVEPRHEAVHPRALPPQLLQAVAEPVGFAGEVLLQHGLDEFERVQLAGGFVVPRRVRFPVELPREEVGPEASGNLLENSQPRSLWGQKVSRRRIGVFGPEQLDRVVGSCTGTPLLGTHCPPGGRPRLSLPAPRLRRRRGPCRRHRPDLGVCLHLLRSLPDHPLPALDPGRQPRYLLLELGLGPRRGPVHPLTRSAHRGHALAHPLHAEPRLTQTRGPPARPCHRTGHGRPPGAVSAPRAPPHGARTPRTGTVPGRLPDPVPALVLRGPLLPRPRPRRPRGGRLCAAHFLHPQCRRGLHHRLAARRPRLPRRLHRHHPRAGRRAERRGDGLHRPLGAGLGPAPLARFGMRRRRSRDGGGPARRRAGRLRGQGPAVPRQDVRANGGFRAAEGAGGHGRDDCGGAVWDTAGGGAQGDARDVLSNGRLSGCRRRGRTISENGADGVATGFGRSNVIESLHLVSCIWS
ncbi:hypothetical protein DFJ74DRAFT_771525 [Hyaloraphidium curvatum]|nr:hypothetical protein DFJ74DRAFT_771525 [Hyaloraphidium curvatum]